MGLQAASPRQADNALWPTTSNHCSQRECERQFFFMMLVSVIGNGHCLWLPVACSAVDFNRALICRSCGVHSCAPRQIVHMLHSQVRAFTLHAHTPHLKRTASHKRNLDCVNKKQDTQYFEWFPLSDPQSPKLYKTSTRALLSKYCRRRSKPAYLRLCGMFHASVPHTLLGGL